MPPVARIIGIKAETSPPTVASYLYPLTVFVTVYGSRLEQITSRLPFKSISTGVCVTRFYSPSGLGCLIRDSFIPLPEMFVRLCRGVIRIVLHTSEKRRHRNISQSRFPAGNIGSISTYFIQNRRFRINLVLQRFFTGNIQRISCFILIFYGSRSQGAPNGICVPI